MQRLADVVARWFVLIVIAIAIVTAIIWSAFGPEPRGGYAVLNAIAVLIIACPCALGLATPMSVMVATGRAATSGILFRDAEALETLHRIDTLIVDKTGTLTLGKPVFQRAIAVEPFADDAEFQAKWRRIKRENKQTLASVIQSRTGIDVAADSLFDVHVKRLHEYKRQHLNALHIITLYNRLKREPGMALTPRTFIFGGKAAPGYVMAKLIIRLINGVGEVVNADPDVAGRLKVVFFPDFNVKNGAYIYPAADLSEQISTAGKEASGTGNMKLSLNGALTIGTLDGANVEIREEVGAENFFLFGLTSDGVQHLKAAGYDPRRYHDADAELREALDQLASGLFSRGDASLFRPLVDSLLRDDPYLVLADYRAYVDAQQQVSRAFEDTARWTRMSILNVARMGKFSSDRSIREYCERIWSVEQVPVELKPSRIE
jgi:starch phosphorylase